MATGMDVTLDTAFQRVETALVTLVDSIAAYNPSLQAAGHLVAADEELARGIDQLAQHQENNTRIQALRAEADALEEQFKSSVATLADLRRELLATSITEFPENLRPVPFDELLQYAKNIAQTTVPPTYREPPPQVHSKNQSREAEDGVASAVPSNGVATPAQQATQGQGTSEGEPQDGADKVITEEEAEWLKKLKESNLSWFPWPDEDKIRRGNLMQIQYALDRGRDPTNEDLTKIGEDEKDRIAAEAAAAAAQSEAQAQAQMHAEAHLAAQAEQRQDAPPPRPAERPQKVFSGFDALDDDDDSE